MRLPFSRKVSRFDGVARAVGDHGNTREKSHNSKAIIVVDYLGVPVALIATNLSPVWHSFPSSDSTSVGQRRLIIVGNKSTIPRLIEPSPLHFDRFGICLRQLYHPSALVFLISQKKGKTLHRG